jgi:hypothetical protein
VKIELTDEQTEFIAEEELKISYKVNKDEFPEDRDEELIFALEVVLKYFMGASNFNEWKDKNT